MMQYSSILGTLIKTLLVCSFINLDLTATNQQGFQGSIRLRSEWNHFEKIDCLSICEY
jgi:hypothetical protein